MIKFEAQTKELLKQELFEEKLEKVKTCEYELKNYEMTE